MIVLSARDLSRQFDSDPVFKSVTFDIRLGERVGLVGPNGTGKSTLLNILAGTDEADTGQIDRNSNARIGFLEQHPDFAPEQTLRGEAARGLEHLYQLQRNAEDLAEQMADASPDRLAALQKRYDAAQQLLEQNGAYQLDHRIDEVLTGLGFDPADHDRPMSEFSGGQQNRALLARLLLESPELMLLDEPTNHLDIEATEWLESYLARSTQAILLVSHDRYFLDRVTTRTFELFQGGITDYRGNFSAYWKQREERAKLLEKTHQKQQEFVERTEDFIRRNKYGQKHAQASDREKKLERMESVELMQDFATVHMNFGEPERAGDWVFESKGLSKGFGEPLFEDVNVQVLRGDRIGLLGPNGCGKTTLLRTLLGELEPDEGIVRHGANVKIAYFDQQLKSVNPDLDAVEAARPDGRNDLTIGDLRSMLARFGIRGDLALQQVGVMSGGERSKVALARLAATNANVLILDEPTNHLDLWARDALEEALKTFEGTMLFVSHDRYFLDQVATRVLVLSPDEVHAHDGNYSAYLEFRESIERQQAEELERAQAAAERKAPANAESEKPAKKRRQFSYRKVEDIEAEIAEKETLVEELQERMADPEIHRDGDLVRETVKKYEDTKDLLKQLYLHWEEAMELN